jgi:hypothetical protein
MPSESVPDGSPGAGTTSPAETPAGEPAPVGGGAATRPEPLATRLNLVVLSLASFCLIGFGVWVVSAGKRYREEYAQATTGWRVGSTRAIEITVVPDDRRNLACASDQVIAGLRCGGARDFGAAGPDAETLQPYNTVGNELLLGAGLWPELDRGGTLPADRFTVSCNYTIKGIIKSAGIRFSPTSAFAPLTKSTTVGTLTECMIPR